jgi:hypothetical protein
MIFKKGDVVVCANASCLTSLTEGKEYEVLELLSISMTRLYTKISIRNDSGHVKSYNINRFQLTRKSRISNILESI